MKIELTNHEALALYALIAGELALTDSKIPVVEDLYAKVTNALLGVLGQGANTADLERFEKWRAGVEAKMALNDPPVTDHKPRRRKQRRS